MSHARNHNSIAILVLVATLALAQSGVSMAEPPAAPPVSSYAPVKLLEEQVEFYAKQIESDLADQTKFDKDIKENLRLNSNTLVVLALAIGLHDEDSPLKPKASALLAASQRLAKSLEDFEAAKVASADVRRALETEDGLDEPLKWEKVASLGALMLQVPRIEGRITRGISPRNFARRSQNALADTATLAVIAQAAIYDTHEVHSEADVPKWYEYCEQLREAATGIGNGIRAKDLDATVKAAEAMSESCENCHKAFRVE
jgi:hypothetical protein